MDFNAALQTWIAAVTRPGTEFFEQESTKPEANLTTAIIWVVIAGVVSAIFGAIAGLTGATGMAAMFEQMGLPAGTIPMGGITGFAAVANIVLMPIFFLIGAGILHLIATVLGGKGDYGRYAYLLATFYVPLSIVASVISIIPVLGGCVAMLLSLYEIVLAFFATKVNYRLTDGKAIAVVLAPVILVVLLAFCAGAFIAAALSGLNS
jgi:hypothetical protein